MHTCAHSCQNGSKYLFMRNSCVSAGMPEEQCMVSFKLFAAISKDYCPSKNSDTVSHY